MEEFALFCRHYGIVDKPFSRLPNFILRKLEEVWGTTELEEYFFRSGLSHDIITSRTDSVRSCLDQEHYFYLYGACWGLNLREIKEVSLITLMHIYESLINRRYFGECNLKEKFAVTDVTYLSSLVETFPDERYFLTVPLIEARLSNLKRDIEITDTIVKFREILAHPLCPILLRIAGAETKMSLVEFLKKETASKLFDEVCQLQTVEEVIEKYKILVPKKVTPFSYVRDNILDAAKLPYTQDIAAAKGYYPAFSSSRSLRSIYTNKSPCYSIKAGKLACGYDEPTQEQKLSSHYLGVNVTVRAKAAHEAQVNSLRDVFPAETSEDLKKYITALYELCVSSRGGTDLVDTSVFFVLDKDNIDYYYKKLSPADKGVVDDFPFLTSFFTQETASHRNRLNRKEMLHVFRTCCTMMALAKMPCATEIYNVEYIF